VVASAGRRDERDRVNDGTPTTHGSLDRIPLRLFSRSSDGRPSTMVATSPTLSRLSVPALPGRTLPGRVDRPAGRGDGLGYRSAGLLATNAAHPVRGRRTDGARRCSPRERGAPATRSGSLSGGTSRPRGNRLFAMEIGRALAVVVGPCLVGAPTNCLPQFAAATGQPAGQRPGGPCRRSHQPGGHVWRERKPGSPRRVRRRRRI
jgi:hypothetical protein